jgi:hypothetical protein
MTQISIQGHKMVTITVFHTLKKPERLLPY